MYVCERMDHCITIHKAIYTDRYQVNTVILYTKYLKSRDYRAFASEVATKSETTK